MDDCAQRTGVAQDTLVSFPAGGVVDVASLLHETAPAVDDSGGDEGGARNAMQSQSLADGLVTYGRRMWREGRSGDSLRSDIGPWASKPRGTSPVRAGFMPMVRRP